MLPLLPDFCHVNGCIYGSAASFLKQLLNGSITCAGEKIRGMYCQAGGTATNSYIILLTNLSQARRFLLCRNGVQLETSKMGDDRGDL